MIEAPLCAHRLPGRFAYSQPMCIRHELAYCQMSDPTCPDYAPYTGPVCGRCSAKNRYDTEDGGRDYCSLYGHPLYSGDPACSDYAGAVCWLTRRPRRGAMMAETVGAVPAGGS